MGCRDQESNFGNLHYSDGKWWATWGHEGSVEAPERAILEAKLSSLGGVWAVSMTIHDTFIARQANIPEVDRGIYYNSNCPTTSS